MAVEHTGGMTVQTDTFTNPVFKDSFKRVFAKPGEDGHMALASNATFEVNAAATSIFDPHSVEAQPLAVQHGRKTPPEYWAWKPCLSTLESSSAIVKWRPSFAAVS